MFMRWRLSTMNIVSEKIKSCYNTLPSSERLVADYVLERKDDLFQYPIKDFSMPYKEYYACYIPNTYNIYHLFIFYLKINLI